MLIRIGTADSDGADNFDLGVCTPEWLCKHQWGPDLMRHTLLVRKYDLDEIKKSSLIISSNAKAMIGWR